MFKSPYFKRFIHTVLETIPFFGLIFLVSPSLIMVSDKSFVVTDVVLYGLIFSCILSSILLSTLISFLPDRYYRIVIALFRSLFVVSFIVTIFFPIKAELEDGHVHEILTFRTGLKFYVFYFLAVFLSMYVFSSKNILKNIFSKLFVIMAVSSAGICILNFYECFQLNNTNNIYNTSALNDLLDGEEGKSADLNFGTEKNIIFIMADMLQGSTLEQFLSNNPAEKNGFEGFTLYSRAVSPFPFTFYGVPALLTGNTYINGEKAPQKAVLEHVQENSFLHDTIPYGYDRTIISIAGLNIDRNQYSYSQIRHTEPHSLQMAIYLVDLGLKRVFRQQIASQYTKSLWVIDPIKDIKLNSRDIMNKFAHSTLGKSRLKLIYFHNMIPHAPTVLTSKKLHKNAKEVTTAANTLDNYWLETSFFLGQVRDVFDQMKRLGIYDNSLIIISGDHGHYISTRQGLYKNALGTEDFYGNERGPWARSVGSYNAAILIKPPLSSEPLKITRAASSTTGIRSVVQKYLSETDYQKINFFEQLEKNSKQKVIVFREEIKTSPDTVADDHVQLMFEGNVCNLRDMFIETKFQELKDCTIGTKIAPANDYLFGNWIKETPGAWLPDTPGTLGLKLKNVDVSKEYILRLELKALTSDKYPTQRVHILINGKDLGVHDFRESKRHTQDISIPSNILLSNKINTIEFQPLNPISPKSSALGNTEASMSFFLFSVQLISK